jgi:hypothetical protein
MLIGPLPCRRSRQRHARGVELRTRSRSSTRTPAREADRPQRCRGATSQAMEKSRVDALLIHAAHLNAATTGRTCAPRLRRSSRRAGGSPVGAHAVVLTPAGAGGSRSVRSSAGGSPRRERGEHRSAAPGEHRGHRRDAGRSFQSSPTHRRRRVRPARRLTPATRSPGHDLRTEEGLALRSTSATRARPSAPALNDSETPLAQPRRHAFGRASRPAAAGAVFLSGAAPTCPARRRRDPMVTSDARADRREPGVRAEAASLGRGFCGLGGSAALRPRSNSARWCTISRAQRRRPPAPGPAVERGVARAKVADAAVDV